MSSQSFAALLQHCLFLFTPIMNKKDLLHKEFWMVVQVKSLANAKDEPIHFEVIVP